MSDRPDEQSDGPLPLFAVRSVGKLAGIGITAGFISIVTIIGEILTGGLPARMLGYSHGFVSLPLGVAVPIIAALTARESIPYALPVLGSSVIYWGLFAVFF